MIYAFWSLVSALVSHFAGFEALVQYSFCVCVSFCFARYFRLVYEF